MMNNDYFVYRRNLDFLSDLGDSKELVNKLKEFINRKNFTVCVLLSDNIFHAVASINYSLRGEIGYMIWGDKGGKGLDEITGIDFKGLIENYRNSIKIISGQENQLILDLTNPLMSIFLVRVKGKNDFYVAGLGLLISVEYDYFRNFKYWIETGSPYVIRPKIKVLYLPQKIRARIETVMNFETKSENELLNLLERLDASPQNNLQSKDLIITRSQCYSPIKKDSTESKVFNVLYNYIKSKFDNETEIYETLSLYRSLLNKVVFTPSLSIQTLKIECKPAGRLNFPESMLASFEGKLKDRETLERFLLSEIRNGNILFVGPPGTGKTELAINLAKRVSGQQDECYMLATANSLWFRRDVIGGETIINGNVIWKSGIFIKAYNKAFETNSSIFPVVLDEINRADVDKAFGELLTIFSSINPNEWRIPNYLIDEIKSYEKIDKDAEKFLQYYETVRDEPLKKIRIIATMNLVDARNLFNIGEALTRRFFVLGFNYPKGAEDIPNANDQIKNFVSCLREKFGNEYNKLQFNISPASVIRALNVYNEIKQNDIELFVEILRGTLGTVNVIIAKKYDEFSQECLKSIGAKS